MSQKTSDSLDNLHFDDWSSLLSWNAFLVFDTRFNSGKMNVGFNGQNGHNSHDGLNDQDGHDVQNGLDGHDNHSGPNGHNKVNAMNPACAAGTRASHQEDGGWSPKDRWITPGDPVFRSRASWERFDFPEDFLLADASMVFHLQQCRHTVCKEGACLDDLHSCRQPFDPKKLVTMTLEAYD